MRIEFLTCDCRYGQILRMVETLKEMACMLENLHGKFQQKLVWIKRTEEGVELRCCPADIRVAVRELYFDGEMRTILTSATLTNAARSSAGQSARTIP